MKIKEITIDPDPYKPFCLAQGYRVGELLFISGLAAIDRNGQLVGIGNFDAQAEQVFATSFSVEFIVNDPTVKAIIEKTGLLPEKVTDIAGSVVSIKVYGVKPAERS